MRKSEIHLATAEKIIERMEQLVTVEGYSQKEFLWLYMLLNMTFALAKYTWEMEEN